MAQVSYGTITITDITDIESIKNWYLATNSSSGVTKNTSGWTDTIQQIDANKQYLWNYEQILGTGNVEISSTQPTIIGHYGVNGQPGAEGNSIVSIDEYYKITNSTTNPGSSSWTKNSLVVPTSTNRYLWNYQVINYSKTSAEGSYLDARIIGIYGDTGQRGSSILKVTTTPTSTSGTAGGFSYSYRMSLTTVTTESGKSEVLIGDIIEYNSNHYKVGYVNSSYVFLSAATSIKGADGQTYYTHILYSSKASPTSSSDVSTSPTNKSYVGIQTITSSTAPAWNDSGWVWMKYIGTDGSPGPQGVSVTGVKEIYFLKRTSDSVPTAPTDGTNITSTSTSAGVWTTAVPKYISGAKYYTSIQTLLSSGTSPIYSPARLNSGLTDANQNALDAYNTSTARDTEVNALKAQAKHYWWDSQGAHVAAGNNTTSVDNITQGTPSTYGFNSLMAPGYLMLKYKDINFVQLATNSLTFYRPATDGSTYVQGKKGMDLTSNALTFYKPLAYNSSSEPTAAAQLGSNGLVLSEGGVEAGSKNTTDYIYIYSHDDATNHTLNINSSGNKSDWRIVAGKNFGVDKGGNLYASNVNISGLISATEGTIGGFTIGSDNIHHTKTSYSETTNNGIWLGTDGIGLGKGLFYVTNTGSLTAKSGMIGGITIGSNYLTTNSSRTTYDAATSGLTITPSGIGAGNGSTNTFKVDASTGALTAGNATLTGGSIAGWSFNTTSLYKNNATPGAASNAMVISTGTYSSNSIGGSSGSQSWMLSAGTGFGVTTGGVLYATGAKIAGEVVVSKLTVSSGATISDTTGLISNSAVQISGRNLFKNEPISYSSSSYQAYQIGLTENLVAGETYTIQFWDINVYHTGKSDADLGIDAYWGGGSLRMAYWHGTSYFTTTVTDNNITFRHADHLTATFTVTSSQASGSGASNLWFNIYNSVSSASGTLAMSIGHWKIEKSNKGTEWSMAPEDMEVSISNLRNDISTDLEDLQTNLAAVTGDLQELNAYSETEIERITQNVNEYLGTNGYMLIEDQGLKITKGNFAVVITGTDILFQEDGTTVAWISGQKLYINRTEVTQSMKVGNFEWMIRTDGRLTLAYTGGN